LAYTVDWDNPVLLSDVQISILPLIEEVYLEQLKWNKAWLGNSCSIFCKNVKKNRTILQHTHD